MRTFQKILFPVVFSVMVCGCNTNQDPLAGQPDRIRNGIPPQEKPKPNVRLATTREWMILEMDPGIANFTEGLETSVQFKGRVIGDEKFELLVPELPPGGSFDPASGIFTWTPPSAFIKGMSYYEPYVLKVEMVTTSGIRTSISEEFNLNVFRNTTSPEIISASGAAEIKEGSNYTYDVVVNDPDAINAALVGVKQPYLTIVPSSNNSKNISPYVRFNIISTPVQDHTNPSLWKFKVVVELTDREVTSNKKDVEFGIKAYSGFGIPSLVRLVQLKAFTRTSPPMSTISKQHIKLIATENNNLFFDVFSEQKDGKIETNFNELVRQGAKVNCAPAEGALHYLNCHLTWKPTSPRSRFTANFKIINRNLTDSAEMKESIISNTFEIVAPPAPPAE